MAVVTICTTYALMLNNATVAHRVYFIRTINSDFSLNKINWLMFLMERQPNYCAVGTERLYIV